MFDELSDLRLFTKMVSAGSLSETARRLNSSLTAMSRRLSQMEERLGVRLIDRGSRRFSLTEEGELLFARGTSIIAEIDEMEAEVSAKVRTPKGRLRVSAPSEIGRLRIAPLVSEFTELYPATSIELILTDAKPDVLGDELDLGLQTDLPSDGNLIVRKLLESSRVVCASPRYLSEHAAPQAPQDLTQHNCIRVICWGKVFDRWRFVVDGVQQEVVVSGALTANGADVAHSWILDGRGIGLKARWDIQTDLEDGRLVEVLVPYSHDPMNLYAVYASRNHLPQRMRMFIDFISSGLQNSKTSPSRGYSAAGIAAEGAEVPAWPAWSR
jgi:DNA-binding transcriptional LysR family regulator